MSRPFKREAEGSVAKALSYGASDAQALVDVCYHAVLGRAPDPAGLTAYCGMIHDRPDRETLIAMVRSIAMSEEARDYREHHLSAQERSAAR
ncbi:DUF4214 domain-containing protein [Sphingomonas dokdonensis]|uniref:DUF4214 domain-containing protein n=1 Tax=Sphingomonas dokdonensis TaxID=344880 RepID=A0A245ZUW7_9SPHN|nr:DUF4214 domain-containing protein [Sphingomonas dokdonensis]OWK33534.1 hypothetical protein SPDO_04130 [Sphingomonas dokdonensis]